MEDSTRNNGGHHHKRTKSSVLKSIIAPRQHRRNPSAGDTLGQIYDENNDPRPAYDAFKRPAHLTPNEDPYSYGAQSPLGELVQNQLGDRGPSKSTPPWGYFPMESAPDSRPSAKSNGPSREKLTKGRENRKTKDDKDKPVTPKKPKSHTSLGALLSRPKSSKGPKEEEHRDERSEKQQPRVYQQQQVPAPAAAPPPIYAQFASQLQNSSQTTSVPLKDADLKAEISRYTPIDYSPSKQRVFHEHERPTLGKRGGATKGRPKSEYLTSSTTGTVLGDAMQALRRSSNESDRAAKAGGQGYVPEPKRRPQSFWGGRGDAAEKKSDDLTRKSTEDQNQPHGLTVAKRGSRVMAAVAAFNMKAKEADKGKNEPTQTQQSIENLFEALLDSRNVPQNMRQKLRSLDARIKADFVKQDQAGNQTVLPGAMMSMPVPSTTGDNTTADHARPSNGTDGTKDGKTGTRGTESGSPRKRGRPRSKTFSLHRSEKDAGSGSPIKKQKSGGGGGGDENARSGSPRTKSAEYQHHRSTGGSSSKSLTSSVAADAMALGFANGNGRPQPPVPQDFVKYLQKVQRPQEVEVGRLHKLRLVLRNERVAWVDSFITMGGMMEVVGLLRRIMKVEWREEHEDALLHEVLLCLKALCTTKLALRELDTIQASLFPELIAMIFDEEHKGPSEFTTRGIVFSLLLTYLADAPSESHLSTRATALLSYLRDPSPPSTSLQPLGFIQSMHQPRPYKVWCKELVSVTKEVFWIFLHQTNVIPVVDPRASSSPGTFPSESTSSSNTGTTIDGTAISCATNNTTPDNESKKSYSQLHFPRERPPVPAAPYVGGVEWDATNYLSSHLDLLNGLLASLPTTTARNELRDELRMSGFEKVMGGSLRTCKEKFYGAVHDGLKTWVAAAREDGWVVDDVRRGPVVRHGGGNGRGTPGGSPVKGGGGGSPVKEGKPPMVELPLLGVGGGGGGMKNGKEKADGEGKELVDAWVC